MMQMTIKTKAADLDTLLDGVVEGKHDTAKFNLSLEGISASVMMQVLEITQIEKGKISLAA